MSNIDANLNPTANKQELFVDLDQKDAEIIGGGWWNPFAKNEKFTIYNETKIRIPYTVDGTKTSRPYGGSASTWNTKKGGEIKFDYDFGRGGYQERKYNLSDGGKYAFRYDTRTSYAHDIELYKIG